MELKDLYTADKHEDGAEMQVLDENNNETDIYIRIAGMDSQAWQEATRDKQQKSLTRLFNKDSETNRFMDDVDDMVNAAIGWRGVLEEGKELEFSKERVRKLFIQAPFIIDQAILFVNNRANFTRS